MKLECVREIYCYHDWSKEKVTSEKKWKKMRVKYCMEEIF